MPFTDAGLKAGVDGVAAAGNRISFHTADPGTTGASEIAGTGRPATTWSTSNTTGVKPGSQVSAPIPAATAVTHWGIWSAASGGTFLGGFALAATETFGSAGTIQHTPTLTNTN